MASRIQQDTFMDDSDDSCPLCVEEFDLSDKNFKPCPCGYQVCQFCYNNIKTNMNGLCPACRRPYEDKNIEWKVISHEEAMADMALQAKKKALARQKETERRQVETLSRKHLAGLRVMQKNLVYVVGLNPKSREEDLLQTLRGDQYFGQYGKIIKIVVSKAKEGANGSNSQGIYVTFAREEDAQSCIKAVDRSPNGDRVLRAQFGTTKYCSAYLRNETCNNRSCMFLHDSGEGYNNVSRQDASKMNASAVAAQGPAPSSPSPTMASRSSQQQPQPAPQREAQVSTAASLPMARHISQEQTISRSESTDSSALPSSASWATKNANNESRRSSKAASVSASSPVVPHANLPTQVEEASSSSSEISTQEQNTSPDPNAPPSLAGRLFSGEPHPLDLAMKTFLSSTYKFTFDRSIYTEEALKEIDAYPPLFDANGGLVRYRMEKEREQERLKQEEDERNVLGSLTTADEDENPASGSLQLGGEPETQDRPNDMNGPVNAERGAIQPPYHSSALSGGMPFNGSTFFSNHSSNLPFHTRSLTPHQQQQLLQQRSAGNLQSPINNQYQHASQHHHQPSNPFQAQTPGLGLPGHTRQASRYTFANDSSSASAAVNPSANAQLMAQQSAMMPTNPNKMFQSQAAQHSNLHTTHFYSGVQGPPPGLKSSGTPPISGGGMFGQGHGFTSAIGGSIGLGRTNGGNKNGNEELMRELLRGRNGAMNGQGSDVGKREFDFLSSVKQPKTSNATSASSLLSSLYGSQLSAYNGHQDGNFQKQKKKGKKHRHANTSSSGGGGIVDLADPSILQARMHHGGVGQGQFGAQGQEPFQLSRPDDPNRPGDPNRAISRSVNDINGDLPANLLSGIKVPKTSIHTPAFGPPGLSSSHDFPPLAAPQAAPPLKAQRKGTGTNITAAMIKPIIPVLPGQQNRTQVPFKESRESQIVPPPEDIDALASSADAENTLETTRTRSGVKFKLKTKLPAANSRRNPRSKIVSDVPATKAVPPLPAELDTKPTPQKAIEKRHPGKLDIAAAKDASKKDLESVAASSSQTKSTASATASATVSRPNTPATAVSQALGTSIQRQTQPRTIRVLPTPKMETPPRLNPASPSVVNATASIAAGKQQSRRASLSSVHPPGTPASEKVSDNASFTSASISRANSPPPSKVGSAPVRQVTKSQQKKERQVRAKLAEESSKYEGSSAKPIAEMPVQAPIVGRKKKAKKATRGTADSTPVATRSSSPTPKDEIPQEKAASRPATPVKENKKDTTGQKDHQEPDTPASPVASSSGDHHQKNALTAASILSSLQKSGDVASTTQDLFKGVSGVNYRFELTQNDLTEPTIPVLSEAQRRQIENGEAIVLELGNNKRVVLLPDRRTLHGLTKEQAQRYLEFRKKALSTTEPAMFNSSRHDIDRYLHAVSHTTAATLPKSAAASSTEDSLELTNRFVASASAPTSAAATMPSYWSAAPLTEEAMARKLSIRSVEDAEQAMLASRKETEGLEKKLNGLLKRNRRLVFGNSH